MKKNFTPLLLLCAMVSLLISCSEVTERHSKGPIVLGDSSTIVTENDTKNLKDIVADLHPNIPDKPAAPEENKSQQKAQTDTAHTFAAQAPLPANSLNAVFKEVTISIPDINTKTSHPQNPIKGNAAVYQLISGSLNGKQIRIGNGQVLKVSQHYQTIIVLDNDLGTLPLETLSNITEWEVLNGKNNTYSIAGLNGKLESADFNINSLQKAIAKAARRHRLSRASERQWVNSVRNVRTNKKSVQTVLRYIVWKIDGTDAAGKPFSKMLRIDMPIPGFSKG